MFRRVALIFITGSCFLGFSGCKTTGDTPVPRAVPVEAESGPPAPETALEARTQEVTLDAGATAEDVPLTRDGALLTALLHNRGLDVARLGPGIAETYIPEARAQFDPVLGATLSYGHQTSPIITTPFNLSSLSSNTTSTNNLTALLLALRRLNQTIDAIETEHTRQLDTDSTAGDISLREQLPTGTLLFLTGVATDTDTQGRAEDYRGSLEAGIRQPLLDGAGLGPNLAALRQAKAGAARSEALFELEALELVRLTELAYWDLALAAEVETIRAYAVELADELLKRNEEKLNVGKAIAGDVMAARAEKASRVADLTDANAAIRSSNITLLRLLNPAAETPWSLTFSPADPPEVTQVPVDAAESDQLAVRHRPELAAARFEMERAKIAESVTKNALLPNLDLTGTYAHTSQGASSSGIVRHLDDDYFDEYSVGVEFEMPLMNRAEKARHARARMVTDQAGRTIAELEQLTSANVRQAVIEAERQWQRLESERDAVESRTEQFRVAKGRNEVGKTSLLDLHIVERDFIQSKVDEVTARVRYIQALTNLYAAEGTLLERRGITLDKDGGNDEN